MISAPFSSSNPFLPPVLSGLRGRARALVRAATGVLALGGLFTVLGAAPAAADFRLCNRTDSRVGIAVGYKDGDAWTTEGWWNVGANSCETLLRGDLVARYYYVYAVDYDLGGEWAGKAFMCTREKEFTIRGIQDCLARGFDRTGFFEVDTHEQRSWTVQLTEQSQPGAATPGKMPLPPPKPPAGK